jgi:hypothetical protein
MELDKEQKFSEMAAGIELHNSRTSNRFDHIPFFMV